MSTKGTKGVYESPQERPEGLMTPVLGGSAPDVKDVIKSANARSTKRHDTGGEEYADMNVLPNTSHMTGDEMVGVRSEGYLTKKGIPYGVSAMFNSLPPGMDITDQENADIRQMEMVTITGLGYPGDGWTK